MQDSYRRSIEGISKARRSMGGVLKGVFPYFVLK